jgi:hypothetical protein
MFVKAKLTGGYQYSQRIIFASHYGSSHLHVSCSLVTVFIVHRSVPIGFSYCISLRQGFTVINTKGPLLPGLRGLPALGNIFQIPKFQWLKYMEWKEVFGNSISVSVTFTAEECQVPIFSLNFAGNRIIVLNTHEVATNLMG